MRINLTLAIQIINVFVTILFLKQYFWPTIISTVLDEQRTEKNLRVASSTLEKEISTSKQAQINEEIALTGALQNKLQQLYQPTIQSNQKIPIPSPQPKPPSEPAIKTSAKKIALSIQEKF